MNKSKAARLFFVLRSFLERNKIFFEIFVATSLSFMAIYVSFQANKIAEVQNNITEKQNIPHLEVKMKQERNDTTKIYDYTMLIYNRGGKLTNFGIQTYSFINVDLKEEYSDTASIKIPVYNYWDPRVTLTGNGEDLICWFDNMQNNVKLAQLSDSLDKIAFIDVISCSKITYRDIFDRVHTEYYQLDGLENKISEKKWLSYEELHSRSKKRYMFPKISAREINNIIKYPNINRKL